MNHQPVSIPAVAVQPRKILIVDDAADVAEVMTALLESRGHEVIHFPDGKSTIKWIDTHVTDLAILDLDLPDMTGWDICRHLRGSAHWRKHPILICSGNLAPSLERLREYQADGFIAKPFTPQSFIHDVEAALNH